VATKTKRQGVSPTVGSFRKRAEQSFRNANPNAENLEMIWEFCKWVTFPTGLEGYSGYGYATATGYGRVMFVASETKHGLMVR
jgi:hypothetical protein